MMPLSGLWVSVSGTTLFQPVLAKPGREISYRPHPGRHGFSTTPRMGLSSLARVRAARAGGRCVCHCQAWPARSFSPSRRPALP
jgi:hypothetical protein